MIKNILGTAFSRIINALLMVFVLWIATKNLGAEVYGNVMLIILAVTFIHIVNNMVGGSATVYFTSRKQPFLIFVFAYLWAVVVAVSGAFLVSFLGKIPDGYVYHVMLLTLLLSFTTTNQNILLGKERIMAFNVISVLQVVMLLATLSYNIFIANEIVLLSYVKALYASYGAAFVISLFTVSKYIKVVKISGVKETVKSIMSYGGRTQIANVLQFFNYRLSFYILENFINRAALGVFSAGVQLSEGVWIIGKSVSMVQFSRTANTSDKEYNKILAVNLIKLSFTITALMLIVLLIVPVSLFVFLFGSEFAEVKIVIITLSIGIVIVPCSMIFSAYFAGIGKPQISTYSTVIGLAVTVIVGFTIIPLYGIVGAGITASATYLVSAIYLFIMFNRLSGAKLSDFMIKNSDWSYLYREFKKTFLKR
ncbi:MAG: polysaccharide biosynthesis C-terminal domain-containing protein [Bacteroidota bacterium]|nr:polysaccharide biosynthesis C-terminal domain-containing protein [Bacteroidota bacterium]